MEVEVILGTPLKRAQAKGLKLPHLELTYSLCSATNASSAIQGKKATL
jgi:2-dehydropantoate 2-reductase